MKINKVFTYNGYTMRLAEEGDAESYFQQNYCPLDREVVRFTGCKESFSREEVMPFFHRSILDEDRYFFLVIAPDGQIVGESVINEIDFDLRSAGFRIAIFRPECRNQGLGSWMVAATRDFAFAELKLHRLELEVYSFNPRAERAYQKAGFRREGIRRDAVMDGDGYADVITMSILEAEWQEIMDAR